MAVDAQTKRGTDGGFTPIRVDNSQALIGSLAELGYRLVNRWRDVDSSIAIPSESGIRVKFGHGMHFQRDCSGRSRVTMASGTSFAQIDF